MTSPNLSDLIERVEAASGPDRELDALIAVAASKEPTARVAYMAGRRWYKKPGAGRIPFAGAFGSGAALGMIFQDRRYTASLDAAMTLIPKGAVWTVTDPANADGGRSIFGCPSRCHATVHPGPNDRDYGATPALALVAACLRALQEKDIDHG